MLRWLTTALLVAPIGIAGWLWWSLLSPYTYDRPDHLPAIQSGTHEVFVYGTLRYAPVRWLVYGRVGDPQPAVLEDYRRNGLDIDEAPEERVEGLLIEVDASELARLDRYERLGLRYERQSVTLSDGTRAWTYRRLEED
ncbi:gamma-glutamylcyclotransferase family protein [Billgrantia gudaonensis]|uniref:Gamma-glutamyl cyclotransferase, AIG2-like n=1 Tax=Billgrantia gudaonensis TaxID=376427 RepID=A0A1G8WIZ4_9GAMM|nr:gamma-glutamylcyclotransferase family protein [Halomonas gudaonensis]SDJ78322.1 Gamma-glutamyl cyclotransferase, AIG2-like [Halomonas gudaonensis]